MKYYLFVCQHNVIRSKFGAEFFSGYLDGKKIKAKVDSAGLGIISYFFGKKVSKNKLKDVNRIFVMESYMKDYLINKFKIDKKKIVVLKIKDNYGFLRRKNIDELTKKFERVKWRNYL